MIDARHALLGCRQIALVVTTSREEAPGFVEQHPREHRRMIVVAIDHAAQGDFVLLKRNRIRWTPPVRNVGHDQHAEPVGPVQFAWGFDFDVLAQPGQSDLPGAQDFVPQRAVGRERVVARWMVRLIEGELQKDERAVDRHIRKTRARKMHDRDRAHPEVGVHNVLDQPAPRCGHAHDDLVQERIIEGPAVGVRQRNVEVRRCPAARDPLRHHRFAIAIGECESQCQIARRRLEQPHIDADAGQVGTRREVHGLQRVRPASFEVHRLPHASRFAVALLAFELERMRGVVHANHQTLWPPWRRRFQLECKRRVAALMLAQFRAVEPDRRAPIARPEHKEHPTAAPDCRRGDGSRIPGDIGAVGDARQRRPPREGHEDFARAGQFTADPARVLALVARIEREAPPAVQVQPLRSLEIWSRVLWQRDGRNLCNQRGAEECEKVHATTIYYAFTDPTSPRERRWK